MQRFSRYVASVLLAGAFLVPLYAYAGFGISFGGKVVSIIPCVSGGPALYVTIVPAGVFPTQYIWTLATLTYLAGPPSHPGQQILGIADVPFVCFIPGTHPVPLFGLRMQIVGTSAI